MGKSLLIASALVKQANKAGASSALEALLRTTSFLDMSDFRVDQHAGALLGGVGDRIKGERSVTMVYSYTHTLRRGGVVATLDLATQNLHKFALNQWPKDPGNPPAAKTAKRTAGETSQFLQERDPAGPAETTHASGLRGADTVGAPAQAWFDDVRATPSAAHSVAAVARYLADIVRLMKDDGTVIFMCDKKDEKTLCSGDTLENLISFQDVPEEDLEDLGDLVLGLDEKPTSYFLQEVGLQLVNVERFAEGDLACGVCTRCKKRPVIKTSRSRPSVQQAAAPRRASTTPRPKRKLRRS
ncbi:unnamed protein product [Prorocentrum cordatum]|uniref:Uncharacterized protein n=1 Tax=Prorocentrum cordatum TaxID=2364126 RepID=A0ABN9SKX3_9DINO|nr:unnamed protein product [Polarella glacialis]